MRSFFAPLCALFVASAFSLGCSGGSPFSTPAATGPVTSTPVTTTLPNPVTPGGATVSVMVSDPAACKAPNGPYSHIYVAIADVQASTSVDAPAGDPSFQDLTPGLAASPRQVDLLGKADEHCFLASLNGIAQQLKQGDYRQIRVFLAPDSAASSISNNACGSSYSNCLVLTNNSLYDLDLPAAAASGIQISAREIANGGISVDDGSQLVLDVSFDVGSSILRTSRGGYAFSPVPHAGLISSNNSKIAGTVVSSATGGALRGGHVIVALEQKDPETGVDRILMRTSAASDGSFELCPVPQGTYDLVAVGVDGANVSYSAGVETGIQAGQLAGKVALVPGERAGTLQGMVTTANGGLAPAGVPVAVATEATMSLPNGTTITVPLLPSFNPENAVALTGNSENCPAGTDCSTFAMQLPVTAPNVVTCSDETSSFHQQGSDPAYTTESFAQVPGAGDVDNCLLPRLRASTTTGGRPITLPSGGRATAATVSFTQCE